METVPQVFANGSNVGGFRETKEVIQVHGGEV
jgi:glutaredoxin